MKKKPNNPSTIKPSDAVLDIAAYNRSEGEKRPELISVDDLYLDPQNPRLADVDHTNSQASLLKVMEKEFDLQPLVDSIYQNGFFWEEPLVVVKEYLQEFKKDCFIVIEGNRRLSAVKTILNNPDIHPNKEAVDRIREIPAIVRDDRKETLAFVGFRHITGIVPWESAAKAQYAHDLVSRGLTLQEIATTIGDKTKDIGRWVRTQSLIQLANEIGLNESDASKSFYFSYLLTSTDAPSTKRWLELKIDDSSGLVTEANHEHLEQLWLWLYGSKGREMPPIIPESRQIHKLNKVIASPKAVRELQRTGNLERALVETKEKGEYIVETLGSIRSLLQDLAANLAGEDNIQSSIKNDSLKDARSEFHRIDRTMTEIKQKLDF